MTLWDPPNWHAMPTVYLAPDSDALSLMRGEILPRLSSLWQLGLLTAVVILGAVALSAWFSRERV